MSTLVGIEGIGKGSGRAIREEMDPEHYLRASYYERWLWSTEERLLRKGTIAPGEVDAWVERLRAGEPAPRRLDPEQAERDRAAISTMSPLGEAGETRFAPRRPGPRRAPPARRSYALSSLRARRRGRGDGGPRHRAAARHRPLRRADRARLLRLVRLGRRLRAGRRAGAGRCCSTSASPTWSRRERHDHDHDHDDVAVRAAALEALLVEKGLISTDAIDAVVDLYENDVGPQNGARVVARAWVDDAYRERLRQNGTAAIAELGYGGFEGDTMVVVENTPEVHNVIVCTLCSCYPWPVLGLAAVLVQEPRLPRPRRRRAARRARRVRPRARRRRSRSASGTRPPRCATSCCRCGPPGPESLGEEELAALVTRDSMVGTGLPLQPAGAAA